MKDVNKVILIGRLGADPLRRETKSGMAVTNFPLATSRRTRHGEEGSEPTEVTQWHRIVAWGKQAEHCAEYLKKGYSIFVEGSIRTRKYSDQEGEDRMSFEVHADSVSFLGRPLSVAPSGVASQSA